MVEGGFETGPGRGDVPDLYCPECTALRYEGEPSCASCLTSRPEGGWAPLSSAGDPFLGCVIDGRYLTTKREATGGNSAVYRAESLEDDRTVALKIADIRDQDPSEDSDVRRRMSREVRAVQMLENRHIVPIYEFLELDREAVAIVMSYVSGETAAEVVERSGPVEVERAAEIARQVALGLAEAHRSDLIHRDIKPANIMLESGEDETAYVLDFGIVRLQAASASRSGFVGTPLYASPEQIRMESLDTRTDIYSLGATLFFLLSGEPPYVGEETMEAMRAHLEAPVPSVGERRGESVPEQLEELVTAMLAKQPEERPEDLGAVASRLETVGVSGDALAISDRDAEQMDPGGTFSGWHHPTAGPVESAGLEESDKGNGREPLSTESESESAFGYVSGFKNPASSAEFTPEASESSEFERVSRDTDEASFKEGGAEGGTRTGVQPFSDEDEVRRLGAERSIDFWPEEAAGGERLESAERLLAARPTEELLFGDEDGRIWTSTTEEEATGACSAEFGESVEAAALSESYVWVGFDGGDVVCIRRDDGDQRLAVASKAGAPIRSLAVSRDGAAVVVGTADGETIRRRSGDERWRRADCEAPVEAVASSPEGDFCVVVREGGILDTYQSGATEPQRAELEEEAGVEDVAVAADGEVVGIAFANGSTHVVHTATGRSVVDIPHRAAPVASVFFDGDGHLCGVEPWEEAWVVRDLTADRIVTRIDVGSRVRRR